MRISLLFFTFILIAGCSSDPNALSSTIVGMYNMKSAEIKQCSDSANNVPKTPANQQGCVELYGDILCITLDIRSDETMVFKTIINGVPLQDDQINYTIDDEAETITTCDVNGSCLSVPVINESFTLKQNLFCDFFTEFEKI